MKEEAKTFLLYPRTCPAMGEDFIKYYFLKLIHT